MSRHGCKSSLLRRGGCVEYCGNFIQPRQGPPSPMIARNEAPPLSPKKQSVWHFDRDSPAHLVLLLLLPAQGCALGLGRLHAAATAAGTPARAAGRRRALALGLPPTAATGLNRSRAPTFAAPARTCTLTGLPERVVCLNKSQPRVGCAPPHGTTSTVCALTRPLAGCALSATSQLSIWWKWFLLKSNSFALECVQALSASERGAAHTRA